ncbi:MAG: S9 family peptidase [Bacillota bacterium]|nr:S9 family peptidase [Bacillota bacterium]
MEENKVLKAEDLYELKSIADPQLSPDGTTFVFVQTEIDKESDEYHSHLFFSEIKKGNHPVQWTFGKGKNHSPRFAPDGNSVAFESNRSGKSQIYILSLKGGEAKQVTFLDCGATNPLWSPDSKKIAFHTSLKMGKALSENVEDEKDDKLVPLEVTKMKYKMNSVGFWKGTYNQVGVVNLENGEVEQLTEGNHDYHLHCWSPDGERLAIGANLEENTDETFFQDVFLLEVKTKTLSRLTELGYFGDVTWSPDGKHLGMIGHEHEYYNATLAKIWLYEFETKKITCITKQWDTPVGDLLIGDFQQGVVTPGVVWNETSSGLYFLATEKGNTSVYYSNLIGEVKAILSGDQHVYGLSFDKDRKGAIVAISKPTEIGDFYLLSLQDGELQRLTNVNQKHLQGISLSEPEAILFKGANDKDIHGWLMKPVGFEKGKKYPLIFEIHGGPHMMYGNSFMNEFQILAGEGYAVLYINPRGSHGYGQEFVNAVRGDYGGGDYQDLMDAVDYVLDNFDFIDKEKLGVTGGSYGGFMTNWIVGHTNRFKAAVTQRSISNWISFYGVSDIGYYFTEWQIESDLQDIQKLWKHSPLAYVDDVETPLLILHSEKDYRCPIEQAEQLFIALKRLGKETKFVRFPEENHELSRSGRPTLRISRLNYIKNWFVEYIN